MTSENDLFSDDVFAYSNADIDTTDDSGDGSPLIFAAVGAVALLVAVGLGFAFWPTASHEHGTGSITVSGADVGSLKAGAPVMLEQVQVGEVESVAIHRGVPVASLKVNREYRDEIPADSRFEVGSLNWLLPGNVGVKVVPSGETTSPSNRPIEIAIDESILPLQVPQSGYLVVAVLIAVTATALGVVLKVARSAWLGKSLVILALSAAGYLFWTGTWNIEQVQELLNRIPIQVEAADDTATNFVSHE